MEEDKRLGQQGQVKERSTYINEGWKDQAEYLTIL